MISFKVGVDWLICGFFDKGEQFLGDKEVIDSAVFVVIESFPGKDFAVLVSFPVGVY